MFGINEIKWSSNLCFHCDLQTPQLPDKTKTKRWVHRDLRGAHATLKVSQGFLWGEEVIVLVLEVIKLQISRSIHPEQLVSCGENTEVRKAEKEPRGKKGKLERNRFAHKELREKRTRPGENRANDADLNSQVLPLSRIMYVFFSFFTVNQMKKSANGIHLSPNAF